MYIPAQGFGRIDNPEHYRVLYAAGSAPAAFGEAFAGKTRWRPEMFLSSRVPESVRSIATLEADGDFLDLDDARELVRRKLRPSLIATPERAVTQRWALAAYRGGPWDGLRWWSVRDSRWAIYGMWSHNVTVVNIEPLSLGHPAAIEAAEMLGRPL